MVGTRYQTQKMRLRLVMILFGIASAAPAFFGSGAIAAADDGALRAQFLGACAELSRPPHKSGQKEGLLKKFAEACETLGDNVNDRALSDPLRVNDLALKQFLRASVYQVSPCLPQSCNDNINNHEPKGTATIFHVAKDSAGEPLVYFITAAHVVSQEPGCDFMVPDEDTTGQDKVFLSRNFEDGKDSKLPWTEIVIKASEVSRMYKDCEPKESRKKQHQDEDKPSSGVSYDVSILKLEEAFIYRRQSSKPNDSDKRVPLEGDAILELMGDNYSRHAFVGMRDVNHVLEKVGSLEPLANSGSILGYFAGFPFLATETVTPQQKRLLTKLKAVETNLVKLERTDDARKFQIRLGPDKVQTFLIFGIGTGEEPVPGYSGSTIHYYTGGRLHAVGVLNGKNEDYECYGHSKHHDCYTVYFTRLDRRPMWRLFTGLEPGNKITALADDFIKGTFTEERWIHLTQLNDVENFWFGLQIVFKLLAEHDRQQVAKNSSKANKNTENTKCPLDDNKPLDRACIIDMLIGFKDGDSEDYYPTGLINVAKATPAISSCGKRLSIHFGHRSFNGLESFFIKSNGKNPKCIVPVAEDPVAVAEDIEIRKILVKMAYNDIRKLPNSAVDFTAGIAAHDRPFSKAIFGDDNYKSAVTAKSHYQVFGIPLRQGIFDFPAGPDGTKSWSVFGKKPGVKPPLERIPKSGNRFSEKMRDNTNN